MAARTSPLRSRRLVVSFAVVFGLFVLFDLALFGWLMAQGLSQRWLEETLLEARKEAEPLAKALEQRAAALELDDLYVVVASAEETQTYVGSVLAKRDVVRRFKILDADGRVVFNQSVEEEAPDAEPEVVVGEPLTEPVDGLLPVYEDREVELPIGDLGSLVVGLSEDSLRRRIGTLRSELLRQVMAIGVLTLILLAVAYAAVWRLFLRARRLEDQAQEAERMAYVGTLASGLAHEIRSPLNSLGLNMQMLEEEVRDAGVAGASSRRLLDLTRSELSRLEHLATDFLHYARPRALELEELSAAELLERAARVLQGESEAQRVQIVVEDQSGGAWIRADRAQMGQLLLNLVQNGVAATEGSKGGAEVRLLARRAGPEVVLEVTDNGCGIPAEEREKIFDLFYSTRRGGTGLGLAIVQRIAQAHHARLEVDSGTGKGTTVRVLMPLAAPRRQPARSPATASAAS